MCVQDLVTGCCVAVLLVCSAHAQAVKDYDYPVLWNPSTIVTTTVNYTDGPAQLRVFPTEPSLGPDSTLCLKLPLMSSVPDDRASWLIRIQAQHLRGRQ